jgi:hypothetical protein
MRMAGFFFTANDGREQAIIRAANVHICVLPVNTYSIFYYTLEYYGRITRRKKLPQQKALVFTAN